VQAGRLAGFGGAALLALLALATAGGALGASAGPSKGCGTIKAGGHVYTVSVQNGVTCASGLKWATKLAAESVPAKTANHTLGGGPGGFSCVGNSKFLSSSFPGVGATAQVSGFCRQGTSLSNPYFNWFIKA
jgi:hypothetical protein